MANSTWLALTNECLRYALLPNIPGSTQFNDDTQLLEFQWAAKYYVRLAHKLLTLRVVKHFAQRRIQLNTATGQASYPLDVGITPGAIKFRSFYNVTPGGTLNTELKGLDYEKFLQMYPDPTTIPQQAPLYWVLLPIERTQQSPVWNIQLVPTPDLAYNIQYRAQISPYALNLDSDIVMWPVDYEHVLTMWSWGMVERALGEGKEGIIQQLAQKAVDEVELIAGLPDDVRRAVRTMSPRRNVPWPPGYYTGWVASPLG